MNVVLVLSHTRIQFKTDLERIWHTPAVKIINPYTITELVGYRPALIICMPDWKQRKSPEFIARVEEYIQQLMRKSV